MAIDISPTEKSVILSLTASPALSLVGYDNAIQWGPFNSTANSNIYVGACYRDATAGETYWAIFYASDVTGSWTKVDSNDVEAFYNSGSDVKLITFHRDGETIVAAGFNNNGGLWYGEFSTSSNTWTTQPSEVVNFKNNPTFSYGISITVTQGSTKYIVIGYSGSSERIMSLYHRMYVSYKTLSGGSWTHEVSIDVGGSQNWYRPYLQHGSDDWVFWRSNNSGSPVSRLAGYDVTTTTLGDYLSSGGSQICGWCTYDLAGTQYLRFMESYGYSQDDYRAHHVSEDLGGGGDRLTNDTTSYGEICIDPGTTGTADYGAMLASDVDQREYMIGYEGVLDEFWWAYKDYGDANISTNWWIQDGPITGLYTLSGSELWCCSEAAVRDGSTYWDLILGPNYETPSELVYIELRNLSVPASLVPPTAQQIMSSPNLRR